MNTKCIFHRTNSCAVLVPPAQPIVFKSLEAQQLKGLYCAENCWLTGKYGFQLFMRLDDDIYSFPAHNVPQTTMLFDFGQINSQ